MIPGLLADLIWLSELRTFSDMMANLGRHLVNVILWSCKLVFELAGFLNVFLRPKHVVSPTCSLGDVACGCAIQR